MKHQIIDDILSIACTRSISVETRQKAVLEIIKKVVNTAFEEGYNSRNSSWETLKPAVFHFFDSILKKPDPKPQSEKKELPLNKVKIYLQDNLPDTLNWVGDLRKEGGFYIFNTVLHQPRDTEGEITVNLDNAIFQVVQINNTGYSCYIKLKLEVDFLENSADQPPLKETI